VSILAYEDLRIFEDIAKEQGANIVKVIYSDQIIMDIRANYKCRTCPRYGTKPTCPPNIPDFDYFKRLFAAYKYGILVGKSYCYSNEEEYNQLREESGPRLQDILLTLEYQAFQRNYYWAITFIGGSCRGCNSCPKNGKICKNPSRGRIPLEATGTNVFETCRQVGIDLSPFPHPVEKGQFFRIGLFLLE